MNPPLTYLFNWTEKASQSKQNSTRSQSQSNGKEPSRKQSECNYCGTTPSHPKEKCLEFLLKYKCRKCGKEGHIARKCLNKPQNVNALDDSVSDDGQETYHLFTLDTHSVRSASVRKGKKFFEAIKLSAAKKFFTWKTLQLDTASTTNTLAVEDLRSMCPAGVDIHGLIKPSSAILRTYGGGIIKLVGQIELVCETQGKFHTLQFQLLSKDVMESKPPLLSGSDCVTLGLVEIRGNTCSLDRNNQKGGASEVCQLNLEPLRGRVEESGTPDQEARPASLNSATEEISLTEETTRTCPVHGTSEDINVVHHAVISEEKVRPKRSMASEVGVSHVPVPWGKLTKAIVMDAFKDVHTGLGTLGPPLHISMNPYVTPIQAHPHRCPVAKEAKASDAIRDLEKQGIPKKVTEPTA